MDQSIINMALHVQRLKVIDRLFWFLECGILYQEVEHLATESSSMM
jgi:hypothetical protein